MKYKIDIFLWVGILLFAFNSCKILRPNLMLTTPPNYKYADLNDSLAKLSYIIAPNDIVTFQVFTNDGFKMIDVINNAQASFFVKAEATVEQDGTMKMPMIGRVKIAGLTIAEAEKKLEELFSEYYIKPFVRLSVSNKRVIVFPGNNAVAKVIPLQNNNTTVLEAIAMAGGIPEDGKAYKVKLIRTLPDGKSLVYLLDLSTIDGLSQGQTTVLANDIIYVEPRYRPLQAFVRDISPIASLLLSTLVFLRVYKSF
ncbi:MAG TPA: polysaccharide biosynthesis/export family protein [Bacteroidia bacterium]|nr:polysaccharide biosynthesis/export family protein [Bacteroidia bacterium]